MCSRNEVCGAATKSDTIGALKLMRIVAFGGILVYYNLRGAPTYTWQWDPSIVLRCCDLAAPSCFKLKVAQTLNPFLKVDSTVTGVVHVCKQLRDLAGIPGHPITGAMLEGLGL